MINIESLKDYIGNIKEEELMILATKIYMITDFICKDYPNYKDWYFNKQLPQTINSNNRNILFVRNPLNKDEIIAMSSLKNTKNEKKICTLFVLDKYRNSKVGKSILEESMKWLGTTKPFITIPDYKLEMFKSFINKYDWCLFEIVSGLYNDKRKELCFNGRLIKDKDIKK